MARSFAAVLVLAVGATVLPLTGCGATGGGEVVTSTAATVSGVPTSAPSSAAALNGQPGAAARAVVCSGPVVGTTRGAPYSGEDTGASPEEALAAARRWSSWSGVQDGFTLTGSGPDRRLYVYDVAGVGKQALIVRHGPVLKGDGSRATVARWWLESWARCDYSELPDAAIRRSGLQIWSDGGGVRQLTSQIVSFDFSGDCFPGMTALDIGGPIADGWGKERRQPAEYVRNPAAELQDEYFDRAFAEHVTVPASARDSGFERDGAHLWFSSDDEVAYVGARTQAEAWPRARRPIRCA